jgi:hypothetical protein
VLDPLVLDGLLLLGEVLELLPVLGEADDWSLELCPAVELLGELVL